jgi:hypothetical protein
MKSSASYIGLLGFVEKKGVLAEIISGGSSKISNLHQV